MWRCNVTVVVFLSLDKDDLLWALGVVEVAYPIAGLGCWEQDKIEIHSAFEREFRTLVGSL